MQTQEGDDARLDYERDRAIPSDLDLEPVTSEDEDYASAPADYKIATYPADFTLEVLYQKWNAGDFRIPHFQRAFVWKQVQASRLIESFLVGLPVPPVFVYTERHTERYLVIDGQQRLRSIFYYFDGYFGEETQANRRVFRLTGLSPESRFKDKNFSDLREEDQRRLHNAVLRSFVVQQLDPEDDTSMYHIFERLNTGGTLLTNQEIRNCVYQGSFTEFVSKLNLTPAWRMILGKDQPDSREKDVELMIRFFAMRDISGYQKPMKDFLSKFMKKNQNPPAASLTESKRIFEETCKQVVKSVGKKPFHIRSGLNTAVSDAVRYSVEAPIAARTSIGQRATELRSLTWYRFREVLRHKSESCCVAVRISLAPSSSLLPPRR